MHTAVHARGIVDNNTTHHGRADRGWIGWEYTAVRLENLVYATTNYTRLQTDRLLIGRKLILLPMLTCHNQNAVGTALSAKRCTSGTEREGELVFATSAYYLRDFLFAIATDNNLGNLTVETGIGTPT